MVLDFQRTPLETRTRRIYVQWRCIAYLMGTREHYTDSKVRRGTNLQLGFVSSHLMRRIWEANLVRQGGSKNRLLVLHSAIHPQDQGRGWRQTSMDGSMRMEV